MKTGPLTLLNRLALSLLPNGIKDDYDRIFISKKLMQFLLE
jgi:hypothetical protein